MNSLENIHQFPQYLESGDWFEGLRFVFPAEFIDGDVQQFEDNETKKKAQHTKKRTFFNEVQRKRLYEVLNGNESRVRTVQTALATEIGLTLKQVQNWLKVKRYTTSKKTSVNNEECIAEKENLATDQNIHKNEVQEDSENRNGESKNSEEDDLEPMDIDEVESGVEAPKEDVYLMQSTSGIDNPFENRVNELKNYTGGDGDIVFIKNYFDSLVETGGNNSKWFNKTSSGTLILSQMKSYFTKTRSWEWKNVEKVLRKVGYCCGESLEYRKTFTRCDAEPNSCAIQNSSRTFFDENSGQTLNFCDYHIKNLKYPVEIKGVFLEKKPKTTKTDLSKEEELIECSECHLYYHKSCQDAGGVSNRRCSCSQSVLFSPKQLAVTNCSNHMEQMLLDWDTDDETRGIAKIITIRAVSSCKSLETIPEKDKIREFYGTFNRTVPERTSNKRTILAFYQKDDRDILVLAMMTKEYGAGSLAHSGKVVLDLLDTVQFINHDLSRSKIYRRIIDSYFSYAKSIGFRRVHWWAANPKDKDDDYLFNCHPENQKYADLNKLCSWYKKLVLESTAIKSKDNRVLKMEDIENRDISFFDDLFIKGGYYHELVTDTTVGKFSKESSTREKLRKLKEDLTGETVKNSKSNNNRGPKVVEENPVFNLSFFENEENRGEILINDTDPEMRSRIAATANTWLTVQRANNLQFSNEARAISSTSALVKMLIDEQTDSN